MGMKTPVLMTDDSRRRFSEGAGLAIRSPLGLATAVLPTTCAWQLTVWISASRSGDTGVPRTACNRSRTVSPLAHRAVWRPLFRVRRDDVVEPSGSMPPADFPASPHLLAALRRGSST